MNYDLVIKNGKLIDGTGSPYYYSDIGIKDDKIVYIGKIGSHKKNNVIDATGLTVTPGFINLHSHSDLVLVHDPFMGPVVKQGITTELVGQDGVAVAPINKLTLDSQKKLLSGWVYPEALNVEWVWKSISNYLDILDSNKIAVNVATLVPHGNIRNIVMGMESRKPSEDELKQMKALVKEGLNEGAVGLSTGLIYIPCAFAETDELIEICKVVSSYGGIFDIHLRGYADTLEESVEEAIKIAEESGVTLHFPHFGVAGKDNWPKLDNVFLQFEKARERGINIVGNQHSYPVASTSLGAAALPPYITSSGADSVLSTLNDKNQRDRLVKMLEGTMPSDFDNWIRYNGFEGVIISGVASKKNEFALGKSLNDIGKLLGKSPAIATLDLIKEDTSKSNTPFSVSCIVYWSNDDICAKIMEDGNFGFGTDALFIKGKPHPRCYGTFPRVLNTFVKNRKTLPLEKAIVKMTSLPARIMGICNRGLLRSGNYADITIFDYNDIQDNATFQEPCKFPTGIEYVIVNGRIVINKGNHTGNLPGRTIRKIRGFINT